MLRHDQPCPECGSRSVWKDGLRKTSNGSVQRWMCRDCGLRFSHTKSVKRTFNINGWRQVCETLAGSKKCRLCGIIKPLTDFYSDRIKRDSRRTICIECQKEYHKQYYQAHREEVLARTKEYYHMHGTHRDGEKRKSYNREYQQKHREELTRGKRDWRREHPEKALARAINRAISLGEECKLCGSKENLERHHPDYQKPFEVMTVCRSCHRMIHTSKKALIEGG